MTQITQRSKQTRFARHLTLAAAVFAAVSASASNWTGGVGDFLDPANWDAGVPTNTASAVIGNGGKAAIVNTTGAYGFGSLILNDGQVTVTDGDIHICDFVDGGANSQVGTGTTLSTLILNGGTTFFDGPDVLIAPTNYIWWANVEAGSQIYGSGAWNGTSGRSFLVGNGAAANGRLELHNNAVLRIGKNLGLANNGTSSGQTATLVMDGDSELSIASGIEVAKTAGTATIDLSGNSHLVVGASMGVGATNSYSDQGYLTLGTRLTSMVNLTIKDNAIVDCLTLQNRSTANILLTNHAQMRIFDVLAGSNTIVYPFRTSELACKGTTGEGTIMTVAGNARFYVDTVGVISGNTGPALDGPNGLFIGNGEFSQGLAGGNLDGGTGTLIIKDHGTLDLRQGLHLGTANNPDPGSSQPAVSDGTLKVIGPDATVDIGGDLRLAFTLTDELAGLNTGKYGTGRVTMVITGPAVAPINVGGSAYIGGSLLGTGYGQGVLKVVLQDYVPSGPASYPIILAKGGVWGTFDVVDTSAAALPDGLSWSVDYTDINKVVLNVVDARPNLPPASFAVKNGVPTFTDVPTVAGRTYWLVYKDDLAKAGNWTQIGAGWVSDGSNHTFTDDTASGHPARYYRLEATP